MYGVWELINAKLIMMQDETLETTSKTVYKDTSRKVINIYPNLSFRPRELFGENIVQ